MTKEDPAETWLSAVLAPKQTPTQPGIDRETRIRR